MFPTHGQPAETPWRLALVTIMQFAEGLSDRQAAEAVRARIDWKYALGLELTDPGFNFSVLSEFRARLVAGSAEHLLLDALLVACTARGYLRSRGQQRTDSTQVLGVLRVLNRLELLAETLRAALNAVAAAAPDWLRARTPPEWFERYSRRIEDYRLPKGDAARRAYAELVGADGLFLLNEVYAPTAPSSLRHLPAIEGLRQVWIAHYSQSEGQVRLREPKDMPPAPTARQSPYEPEARYGYKRGQTWRGYKVHLTETRDDDQWPHLLTHVATTIATAADMEQLASIHQGLVRVDLLPKQHLVDTATSARGICSTASTGMRSICWARHRRIINGSSRPSRASTARSSRWTGTSTWCAARRGAPAQAGTRRTRLKASQSSRSPSRPRIARPARFAPSARAPRASRVG